MKGGQVNDETAKVKIDAMHQRLRVVELCNIGLSGVMDQLNDRIAVMEGHVRELREANEATVEPKIDPLPKRSTFTVGGEPKYIRILPHGDSGADLPEGTLADYAIGGCTYRVVKRDVGVWAKVGALDVAWHGQLGILSIISIPDPKRIDTMSIEDCRDELANRSGRLSIPNTPEEQRKLPEGWVLVRLDRFGLRWMATALSTVPGLMANGIAPDRDLAEWRLRVACERAVK